MFLGLAVTRYNPPLTHSYFDYAKAEYEKETS